MHHNLSIKATKIYLKINLEFMKVFQNLRLFDNANIAYKEAQTFLLKGLEQIKTQ